MAAGFVLTWRSGVAPYARRRWYAAHAGEEAVGVLVVSDAPSGWLPLLARALVCCQDRY